MKNKEPMASKLDNVITTERTGIHWLKFSSIIYFTVCGGSFGSEQMLNAYPAICFLIIFSIPFFWNIPISLITSELGLALRSKDGMFYWMKLAFGEAVSFVVAIMYWTNYIVGGSVYCVLIMNYMIEIEPKLFSMPVFRFGIPVLVILLVMSINLIGVDFLGSISSVFIMIALSPFIALFCFSLYYGKIHPSDWFIFPPNEFFTKQGGFTKLITVLNIGIWSNTGYDCVASVVEELNDPLHNLTKSFVFVNLASALTYVFTIISVIGLNKNYAEWTSGDYAKYALLMGGKSFKYYLIISAVISNFAVLNSYMLPCSKQLATLGSDNYLGIKMLTLHHPKFKTPHVSIFINSLVSIICVTIPFNLLVQITNIFYSLLIIMVVLAMLVLRNNEFGKNLERPFKACTSTVGLAFIASGPILVSVFLLTTSLAESVFPLIFSIFCIISFYGLYVFVKKKKSSDQEAQK